jgi:hypothetical protein
MNIKNIKNGSLYFNTDSKRVERVLGRVNGQRLWTTFHETQPKAIKLRNLRIADNVEVESYLEHAELPTAMPANLPPLPTI